MKRIELLPAARADLARARDWYTEQQPGLDERLRLAVRTTIERIARHPRLHTPVERGARRARVTGPFPYSIYYRELEDVIEVLAILHDARHPDTWKRRPP